MTKKDIFLISIVAVLAGLYVFYFTDWFKPKFIRIESSARSLREAWDGRGRRADSLGRPAESVTFSLHKNYHLTSVKVMVRAEAETNKFPHALWELASKTGSAPVNGLAYGTPVEGMATAAALGVVEPLKAGVEYRLIVEAGSVKGTDDFSLPATTAER